MLNDLDRALLEDSLYLMLGASFITVGLLAGAFSFLRGKVNMLLVWLSLFAVSDGLRLWIQSESLTILLQGPTALRHLQAACNYVVPIPALLYLREGGFLTKPLQAIARYLLIGLCCLIGLTVLLGSLPLLYDINCVAMSAAIVLFLVQSVRNRSRAPEAKVIKNGLLFYLAVVLIAYVCGFFGHPIRVEPYGFAVLLGSLGYVAAIKALEREEQLVALENEIELAQRLQSDLLPRDFRQPSRFKVESRYLPATSVAGDFYDYLVEEPNRSMLLIADVSGHGIASALISSIVKLAARWQRRYSENPSALLKGMNEILVGNTQTQFVTAACVHLDADNNTLRYAAAGHPPMLLMRGDRVYSIQHNGLILSAFADAEYSSLEKPIYPGDRILLYTDGASEAKDISGNELGTNGLERLLRQTVNLSVRDAAPSILAGIEKWSAKQEDDITLLICDYV